jgi:hypothetical protein
MRIYNDRWAFVADYLGHPLKYTVRFAWGGLISEGATKHYRHAIEWTATVGAEAAIEAGMGNAQCNARHYGIGMTDEELLAWAIKARHRAAKVGSMSALWDMIFDAEALARGERSLLDRVLRQFTQLFAITLHDLSGDCHLPIKSKGSPLRGGAVRGQVDKRLH